MSKRCVARGRAAQIHFYTFYFGQKQKWKSCLNYVQGWGGGGELGQCPKENDSDLIQCKKHTKKHAIHSKETHKRKPKKRRNAKLHSQGMMHWNKHWPWLALTRDYAKWLNLMFLQLRQLLLDCSLVGRRSRCHTRDTSRPWCGALMISVDVKHHTTGTERTRKWTNHSNILLHIFGSQC